MTEQIDFAARLAGFASTRYRELRPPQRLALDGYAAHKPGTDLAVELPTGYGKTLVALLIADLSLEEGLRVAHLTGNNQLSDQVIEQSLGLPGLEAVKFSSRNYPPAGLAAYHDARAIGVMNYWTYFNSSPKVEHADVLIFDDAHLAEQPLAGLFAIRIDRRLQPDLYDRLCDLVLAHTDLYPSVEMMRDNSAGPTTPPELLAFTHWGAIADQAAEILSTRLPRSDAQFVWPTVRPHLMSCGVLIGPSAIEIRPYHPPTQTVIGYRSARQRLYLSATLGTMDDLQRRLGVEPVTSVLDEPVTPGEVGHRIFLLNPGESGPLDELPASFALTQAMAAGRTAWLCASHAEGDAVERLLSERNLRSYRLRGGGDDGALDQWMRDPQGHL
ncbi:MAG TPA: DEAD/DEAH box helicase family protein, partial [Acidimicrobiales bacterium]|nr:DEAD/DEAH box helicase family protein [Acidimicrobiales bacterium]